MSAFFAGLIASIPNVLMGILSKVLSEKILTEIFQKIIIYGLRKLAAMSSTEIDDQVVERIVAELK